jgi:D-arabinose 1-dehydrogenase-like Zn-dependent alcohol dehydrogenase
MDLLPVIVNQLAIKGSVMGTRSEMLDLVNFVVRHGITPEIGRVLPMERAPEAFADMCAGRQRGKIVLTR